MEQQGNVGRVQSDDLQYVVDAFTSRLHTYDVQANPVSIRFYYFNSDNPDLFEAFDKIRIELIPKGYIPYLSQNGEHFLEVTRRPKTRFSGVYVNVIMLVLTLLSTIYVGSTYSSYFVKPGSSEFLSLFYGFIFFSLPLMLILGIHETGHYIVARRHKVRASLPFFIPFPVTIGTFGAFISLRDPVPNKRAMVEIGIAGPLFGFLTALPLLFVASYLSHIFVPVPNATATLSINFPIIYTLLHLTTPADQPVFPMVLAVWVGMFATAMNLLPVGQLDGGHVVRGLFGKKASIVDYIFVAFLFVIGYKYSGWWLLAIFVIIMGLTHPPALDDYSPIKGRQVALGIVGLIMFVLTFTIIPIK
jgi:membrane-associated protease RseP (regulator of RpoE activity)